MAPVKKKREVDSINSKLALVMKSGKGKISIVPAFFVFPKSLYTKISRHKTVSIGYAYSLFRLLIWCSWLEPFLSKLPIPVVNAKPFAATHSYKSTLKALRSGKAKLILIASNTPPLRKSELECRPEPGPPS